MTDTTTISAGERDLLAHYRATNAGNAQFTPEQAREHDRRWGEIASEPEGVETTATTVAGVPALWLAPEGATPGRALLALHGGGFVSGSMHSHRRMFGHIARRAGVRALVLGYRQRPDHPHPAAAEDTESAYRELTGQGLAVALVGDSAGASLALGLAMRAGALGPPVPPAVVGLSPWTDMTFGSPSIAANRPTDALFGGDTPMDLEGMTAWVLDGGDPRDPRVSPLHGDLDALPPTYLQVSDSEMLLDDALRLADAAPRASVDVFPGQQHTFHMAAGRSPVADEAIERIAAWLDGRWPA